MNAHELAESLRQHRNQQAQPPPKKRQRSNNRAGRGGRPQTVTPRYTEADIHALHARHMAGESVGALADGNETVKMYLLRAFHKRDLPVVTYTKKGLPRNSRIVGRK